MIGVLFIILSLSPGTSGARESGPKTYQLMCAVCHGPAGEGYKADNAPALADAGFLASASDEFLRHAIADGRAGTTMSAWAVERGGPLAPDDINAVVSFIRTWDRMTHRPLDERPVMGSPLRGAAIFDAQCAKCHGVRGIGGRNINIGNPRFLQDSSNGFLRLAIRNGRAKTPMSGFGETLGDAGIEDVLSLLRLWQSTPAAQAPLFVTPQPPVPLGPVPLNAGGPEPSGFRPYPATTSADIIKKQLERRAKMAILDARAPSDYMNEHIAGAVSVPFYDPSPYIPALPKEAWLVCYCACPHAESGQLAQKLLAAGFPKVTVLDEGLGYWKSKNYTTRKGWEP